MSIRRYPLVPPRIHKAFQVVAFFNHKMSPTLAMDTTGTTMFPGRGLLPVEASVMDSACDVLRKYFDGTLKPDRYEKIILEKHVESSDEGRLPEECPDGIGPDGIYREPCARCKGQTGNEQCPLCHGEGRIMVVPASSM